MRDNREWYNKSLTVSRKMKWIDLKRIKIKSNFKTPEIALIDDAVSGAIYKYISEVFVDYISNPFIEKLKYYSNLSDEDDVIQRLRGSIWFITKNHTLVKIAKNYWLFQNIWYHKQ